MTDTPNKSKEIREMLDAAVDNGLRAPSRVFVDSERKLGALTMGANLALIQFVTEGILPAEQQAHFMMHLQDFAARLYSGENVALPDAEVIDLNTGKEAINQTFSVDSKLGEVYIAAAELALTDGRMKRSETPQGEAANARNRLN